MQALVTTSRSISQDRFLDRQVKRKYKSHLKYVDQIAKSKDHPILNNLKQTQTLAKTLYKSKSTAKKFYTAQNNTQIKRQNRLLLEKIWKIESKLKCETDRQHKKLQYVSGSNWHYKKKQADAIKEQNKRMANNIVTTRMEVKDYKKKIQNEIKQYLELKNQIRKFKQEDQTLKKSTSRKRIHSERGIVKLRLKDDDNLNTQNQESDSSKINLVSIRNSQKEKIEKKQQAEENRQEGVKENKKEDDKQKGKNNVTDSNK